MIIEKQSSEWNEENENKITLENAQIDMATLHQNWTQIKIWCAHKIEWGAFTSWKDNAKWWAMQSYEDR